MSRKRRETWGTPGSWWLRQAAVLPTSHPQGLKPVFFRGLDAALKRRSSTVVRGVRDDCGVPVRGTSVDFIRGFWHD
ncbi:MAG: hypothetical protein WAM47_19840 [Candidatus Sulfotelmatobacter sp.]